LTPPSAATLRAEYAAQPRPDGKPHTFVAQGGQFLINHRAGNEVHKIIDWTPAASIHKFDDSPNTNALTIKVAADSVRFLVNGTQVQALPRSTLKDLSGNVGIRVNHNLDVHVAGFAVKSGGK